MATLLTTLNTWGFFMWQQLTACNWATVVRALQYWASSFSTEVQVYTEICLEQHASVCSFRAVLVIDLNITWKSSSNDDVRITWVPIQNWVFIRCHLQIKRQHRVIINWMNSNKQLHVFSLSFAHSVHAHLRYTGSCGDSFEECLDESRHFLHTRSRGVCISMVWVNLWASVWTDLKQNTDMMHEHSMNHISLEEDRPRYYAKSPTAQEHVANRKPSKGK